MEDNIGKAVASIITDGTGEQFDKAKLLKSIECQIAEGKSPVSDKNCPECNRKFLLLTVSNLRIECCMFCKSLWFDKDELKTLTGFTRDVPADNLAHRKSRFLCPVCNQLMREYLFLPKQNLLVDKCPDEHGIYLESGELKRVFDLTR